MQADNIRLGGDISTFQHSFVTDELFIFFISLTFIFYWSFRLLKTALVKDDSQNFI